VLSLKPEFLRFKKAFALYLQKYKELNQNTVTPPEPILDMIEKNSAENASLLFTPRALMTPANYEFIATKLNKPEITYADLELFLVHFPDSVDPVRSSFITREWVAIRDGSLWKKPRPCTIVATNANSLIIIEQRIEGQSMIKVCDPLQLRNIRVEGIVDNGKGTTVQFVEKTPGTLFNHTHKNILTFENPEQANTFLNYMNSQISILTGEVGVLNTQPGLIGAGIQGNTIIGGNTFGGSTIVSQRVLPGATYLDTGLPVDPALLQTGYGASQITPINAESIITRQFVPTEQTMISNQFATPIRGQQQYFSNDQLSTPISQNGFISQPGQVMYQTINGQLSPINQLGQVGGEL